MRFYDRYFSNNYNELITYYPRFYRDVLEMRAILEAHGAALDVLQDGIERTYLNNFIDYADERTIADFERFIGIQTDADKTLEQRRMLVKSYLIGFGKISASVLSEIIKTCTGYNSNIRFEPIDSAGNNALLMDVDWQSEEAFTFRQSRELAALLGNRIPAHIRWGLTVSQSAEAASAPLRITPVTGDAYFRITVPAPSMESVYEHMLFVTDDGNVYEYAEEGDTCYEVDADGNLYYLRDENEPPPTFIIEDNGALYREEAV